MVFYKPEPLHLLLCKVNRTCIPAKSPLHEIIVDLVRKRLQIIGISHFKAYYGYKISKLSHCASLYLIRLFYGITVPQTLNCNALAFQLLIQFFQAFYRHGTIFVTLVVNDTKCNYLVLVFFYKLMERLDCPVNVFLLLGVKVSK